MVRLAHGLAAGAVALAVAGAWLAAADDGPVLAEVSPAPAASPPAAEAAGHAVPAEQLPSALALAAARLCADGCDAQPAPSSELATVTTVEPVAGVMPADPDAWSLSPEPLQITAAPLAVVRLFNLPPAPDEHDSAPADESDPYAPPAEPPAPQQ